MYFGLIHLPSNIQIAQNMQSDTRYLFLDEKKDNLLNYTKNTN